MLKAEIKKVFLENDFWYILVVCPHCGQRNQHSVTHAVKNRQLLMENIGERMCENLEKKKGRFICANQYIIK
jgi:hypothetical protein